MDRYILLYSLIKPVSWFFQSSASSSHESTETTGDPEAKKMHIDRDENEEETPGPFIPEPMLCCEAEEGKVPHSLEMLYQAVQCNSASECLVLVAHILLLETGFLPQVRDHPSIHPSIHSDHQLSLYTVG